MNVRLASLEDIDQLVQMRWDFTAEDYSYDLGSYEDFYTTCRQFLEDGLRSGNWYIWVAELEGKLVSHMYMQLIHKVPRPGKSAHPRFGYVTNVYTVPSYRGQGYGSRIHSEMEAWAKNNEVEFLIVWPSDTSVEFYERNGFIASEEAMEKHW